MMDDAQRRIDAAMEELEVAEGIYADACARMEAAAIALDYARAALRVPLDVPKSSQLGSSA